MQIYIVTDLEGISGVCVFQQTREPGPAHEEARHLLMGDVNAAVQGCLDGGAEEIVVLDGTRRRVQLHPGGSHGADPSGASV